jgi:hypothetical protein
MTTVIAPSDDWVDDACMNCILCNRTTEVVPLIQLDYQGGTFRICTQHLPVLIHDPGQLVGLIEGAEKLQPSEHRD